MYRKKIGSLIFGLTGLVFLVAIVNQGYQEANFFFNLKRPGASVTWAQYQTARQLRSSAPELKITWDQTTNTAPQTIEGQLAVAELTEGEKLTPEKALTTTYSFLDKNKDLFRLDNPNRELAPIKNTADEIAGYIHFQQNLDGIPVYGGGLVARLRPDGTLDYLNGHLYSEVNISLAPQISPNRALEIVSQDIGLPTAGNQEVRLMILPSQFFSKTNGYQLAWQAETDQWIYLINAQNGEIIEKISRIWDTRNRETYNSNDCRVLPGTLWINETGEIPGRPVDDIARAAHRNAGITYNYFFNNFGLDSFDGHGYKLVSTVHSGVPMVMGCVQNNAAFIPSRLQIVYGDGDGDHYGPFSLCLDIVGHEWTHAVDYFAITWPGGEPRGLDYADESGALNESYSDFFGNLIENKNWLLGEDCKTPQIPNDASRDMADPAQYGQPDHYNRYVNTGNQSYKVHTNSGIPNKAAYLMSDGGTHYGVTTVGIGKENAAKIWYRALKFHLLATATFKDARNAFLQSAQEIFPGNQNIYEAVKNAFCSVGVFGSGGPADCPGGTPTIPGPLPTTTPAPPAGGFYGQSQPIRETEAPACYFDTIRIGDYQKSAGLVKFSLDQIPVTALVDEAKLALYANNWSGTPTTIGVYQLLKDWTQCEAGWTQASATLNWQTAGCRGATDRKNAPEKTLTVTAIPAWYEFNLKNTAQEWLSHPETNHGLLLEQTEPGPNFVAFASSYAGTETNRLKLMLYYHLPSTTTTPTVSPSGAPSPTATPSIGNITPTPQLTSSPTPSLTISPTPVPTGPPGDNTCLQIKLFRTDNTPLPESEIFGGETVRIYLEGSGDDQWEARLRVNNGDWIPISNYNHDFGWYYNYTLPVEGGLLNFEGQINYSGSWRTGNCRYQLEVPFGCADYRDGDLNCDDKINEKDLSLLLTHWGPQFPGNPDVDLTNDGQINIDDLQKLVFKWRP